MLQMISKVFMRIKITDISKLEKKIRCVLPNWQINVLYSTTNDFFDPPYLANMKPKIPVYEDINVQMKGYDFTVLENYQKVVNRIANILEIDVNDAWATPAVKHKVVKFKPNSSIIDAEYQLMTYERNVQVTDLPSNKASLFIEFIHASLPQGVTLNVHKHLDEHEEIRYIPDLELKELRDQLTDLGDAKKKKKKK